MASIGDIFATVLGSVVFICWVGCMIGWFKRGMPIPKWVHVLAGVLWVISLVCLVTTAILGTLTMRLATALFVLPPVATYFGWLWLFGPDIATDSVETKGKET